ncbi:MAG: hypothetical protein GY861_10770 [bacterium]|nr:hypothetical protein [bacterium]
MSEVAIGKGAGDNCTGSVAIGGHIPVKKKTIKAGGCFGKSARKHTPVTFWTNEKGRTVKKTISYGELKRSVEIQERNKDE